MAEKKLEEFKQNVPVQLSLFFLPEEQDHQYSHTIELYDAIPKYQYERGRSLKRIEGRYLDPIERKFKHRGREYSVIITPARVKVKDDDTKEYVYKDFFPSLREELVEDALRKLACEGKGVYLADKKSNEAGVVFTLYELREELKGMGHTFDLGELKEALFVCAQTNVKLQSADGKAILVSNLFETLGLTTQEDWKGHGQKTKAFVRFNSLVTQCINDKTFRQLNYIKCMEYENSLARWLHKRMSHNFIQASLINKYTIQLSTIIRDSGIKFYAKISNNIRNIKLVLTEMQEKKVIDSYTEEIIYDEKRKNKIVDIKFIITPHREFVSEMKKFNKLHSIIEGREIKTTYLKSVDGD